MKFQFLIPHGWKLMSRRTIVRRGDREPNDTFTRWTRVHPESIGWPAGCVPVIRFVCTMRFALVTRPVRGKYSRWRKGEKVMVKHSKQFGYCVERWPRKGMHLPLLNQCFHFPKSALRFLEGPS